MKNLKNKIVWVAGFLVAAIITTTAVNAFSSAGGGFGYKSVVSYMRTPQTEVVVSVLGDADVTVGQDAVVVAGLIGGLADASDLTWTSSIGAFPYPCAPMIEAVDVGANSSAISCTGDITIHGRNQFGMAQVENLTATINETGYRTNRVYESMSLFKVTDVTCTNDADVDVIRVACDGKLGLPMPIRGSGAVVSVCVQDVDGSNVEHCWGGAAVADDIDLDDYAIDLSTVGASDTPGPSHTIGDLDIFRVRMRAPEGL